MAFGTELVFFACNNVHVWQVPGASLKLCGGLNEEHSILGH